MDEEGINKKVTFHVARHTFATLALNIGIDLKVVSKLLGHSEVRTTEIYAKIIDKTKEDAVQKLPKI
jgi:site-specific recombinase XerD